MGLFDKIAKNVADAATSATNSAVTGAQSKKYEFDEIMQLQIKTKKLSSISFFHSIKCLLRKAEWATYRFHFQRSDST